MHPLKMYTKGMKLHVGYYQYVISCRFFFFSHISHTVLLGPIILHIYFSVQRLDSSKERGSKMQSLHKGLRDGAACTSLLCHPQHHLDPRLAAWWLPVAIRKTFFFFLLSLMVKEEREKETFPLEPMASFSSGWAILRHKLPAVTVTRKTTYMDLPKPSRILL